MIESDKMTDSLISHVRSGQLKRDVLPYLEAVQLMPNALALAADAAQAKGRILEALAGSEDDWSNWRWQLKNRIRDSDILVQVLGLSELDKKRIDRVSRVYRWAISPSYLSLIGSDYENSPIFLQSVPDIRELVPGGRLDPMNEGQSSPAPCVTRRYPDRMIINVTN